MNRATIALTGSSSCQQDKLLVSAIQEILPCHVWVEIALFVGRFSRNVCYVAKLMVFSALMRADPAVCLFIARTKYSCKAQEPQSLAQMRPTWVDHDTSVWLYVDTFANRRNEDCTTISGLQINQHHFSYIAYHSFLGKRLPFPSFSSTSILLGASIVSASPSILNSL